MSSLVVDLSPRGDTGRRPAGRTRARAESHRESCRRGDSRNAGPSGDDADASPRRSAVADIAVGGAPDAQPRGRATIGGSAVRAGRARFLLRWVLEEGNGPPVAGVATIAAARVKAIHTLGQLPPHAAGPSRGES